MTDMDIVRRRLFHWLLPALVIAMILTQQTEPRLLGLGHAASVAGVLIASAILLLTCRGTPWSVFVVASVFALRAMRQYDGSPALDGAYTLAFFVLFALVGAILAAQAPKVLETQLLWVCALSLPLMLLQVLGVSAWTQVLRTDLNDPTNLVAVPTLWRWPGHLAINPLQARPAGFFSSNNTFSVFLLFAMATNAAQWHRGRLRARDIVVAATAVVSMAKIVLSGFVVLAVWRLASRDRVVRGHAAKSIATFVLLLAIYATLFPGILAYNLSPRYILLNVEYRVTDFAAALPIDAVKDWAGRQEERVVANLSRLTPQRRRAPGSERDAGSKTGQPASATNVDSTVKGSEQGDSTLVDTSTSQSAYADMAPALPVLLVAALGLTPAYRRGCRVLLTRARLLDSQSKATLIAVVLAPIITSYVLSTFYATMFGVAILPLLVADGGRRWSLLDGPGAADQA